MSIESECKTWGKISLLRAMCALYDNGLLSSIPEDDLEKIKQITDYGDFYNKQKMSLGGASNYIQVAFACAAMRERVGFENDGMSPRILEKLGELAHSESPDGFTDEQPGYGRFDRYSFLLTSEISDSIYTAGGGDMPRWAEENLKLAADYALFMANSRGDGFNYGRSLSTHGDCAIAEVLSAALSRGLVPEEKIDLAYAYIAKIIDKTLTFWYSEEKRSFDIWWNGRSTNEYRHLHRLIEVNLDMCVHLMAILANLVRAGIEDKEPNYDLIPSPDAWVARELSFAENKSAILLRRGERLVMLPLVSGGIRAKHAAYMPHPTICLEVEGAPEARMIIGTHGDGTKILPYNARLETEIVTDGEYFFMTPHGMITEATEVTFDTRGEIGYDIYLK